MKEILRVLEKNKLMGGGDGSVKYGVGSHAWEFTEKVTNTTVCQSAGPVDGANETMCSFRAEATHLVAMLSILNILQPYVKRKRPFVALYTDSKSVIEALKNPMTPTTKNALKDHHDIIMQLQHMKKKSIFEIDIIHVKAHQDNKDDLTPQEELNIRMDKKASEYYDQKEAIIPLQKAPFFPAQRLCITFQEAPLIASIVTTLQNSEQKGEIEDYFETKFAIHPKMQKQIHWTSIRRTFKTNKKKQSMLTKIMHKQIHTFKKSYQWNTAKTPMCQLCKIEDEDDDHLLTCQNVDMVRIRDVHIKTLRSKMILMKTNPTVQAAIQQGIEKWRDNISEMDLKEYDGNKEVNAVVYRQACIGWNNFMRGILHVGWKELQQKYAENVEKATPGEEWIKKVTESILLMRHDLWINRCKIIKCDNEATSEKRQREAAWEMCNTYRHKLTNIHPKHHVHFRKQRRFFETSTIETLQQWQKQIISALNYKPPIQKRNLRTYLGLPENEVRVKKKKRRTQKSLEFTSHQLLI